MGLLDKITRYDYCVYFAPLVAGNYGRTGFAAGVEISCRWEDKTEVVVGKQGETVTVSATVYINQTDVVHEKGLMLHARLADLDSTAASDNPTARPILIFREMPKIRYNKKLRVAYLK